MDQATIISEFNKQYGYLIEYGLKVNGFAHLIGDSAVISIQTPFIFDRTKLPKSFMGFDLRGGTPENEMPFEFQISDRNKEYIWAYQRFENYVDKHPDLIQRTLDKPNMTRLQMLDALCSGDFEKHKAMCISWEAEGKIPKWKENK
jgi:hypothetical protein